MFVIPLFLLKNNHVIALFLLKNFRFSIIPAQKFPLFRYSPQKAHVIPLFQEQNFRYSYSIIPLQPLILMAGSIRIPKMTPNILEDILTISEVQKDGCLLHFLYNAIYTYFTKGCFSDACFIDRSASCLLNFWLLFSNYYCTCSPKTGGKVYFYDLVFSWSEFSEKSAQCIYL